jgi:hypothetical protein
LSSRPSFCIASLYPPSVLFYSRTSIIPLRCLAPPTSPLRRPQSTLYATLPTDYCPKIHHQQQSRPQPRPPSPPRLFDSPLLSFLFVRHFWHSYYTNLSLNAIALNLRPRPLSSVLRLYSLLDLTSFQILTVPVFPDSQYIGSRGADPPKKKLRTTDSRR